MAFDKKKYDQQYIKDNYARIPINVKKSEKEIILNRAKEKGFPDITKYIKDLIDKDIQSSKTVNVNVNQVGNNNSVNIN